MDGTGLVCCGAGLGAGRSYTESIKCSPGYCLRIFFSGDHDWACPGSWGGVLCPLGPGWKNPAFWSHRYLSPVQPLLLTPWCAGKQTILSVETEAKKEMEKN